VGSDLEGIYPKEEEILYFVVVVYVDGSMTVEKYLKKENALYRSTQLSEDELIKNLIVKLAICPSDDIDFGKKLLDSHNQHVIKMKEELATMALKNNFQQLPISAKKLKKLQKFAKDTNSIKIIDTVPETYGSLSGSRRTKTSNKIENEEKK
jgi:hypothetical protein